MRANFAKVFLKKTKQARIVPTKSLLDESRCYPNVSAAIPSRSDRTDISEHS